jgi:hypothetical protein
VKGYVLGVSDYQNLLDPFISTTKAGVPLEVSGIIHLLNAESAWIRVLMTVFRLFESIELPVEFDESSITDPYNGKPLDPIVKEFKSFAKE